MIAALTDYDNWIALVISALAIVYLLLVIVFPERF